jgi:serine/threonine protein phosphatase PrpC
MKHVVRVQPARGTGQDRAVFVPRTAGAMIVLADGAGGTARGAEAAQRVVDRLTLDVDALDRELAALGGQSTVVAIEVEGATLRGVSVGDSEAWIVRDDGRIEDLTAHQHRKPLLGDGGIGVPFSAALVDGTLVVGSDGLFRYVKREIIVAACGASSLEEVADALIAAARLPGGGLQDDVSLVLWRRE